MELRNRETGAVITDRQFRDSFSNVSFPLVLTTDILNSYGYDPILEGAQAAVTPPYEYSQRSGIEQINGQWFTRYVAGPIFVDNGEATAADQEAAYRQRIDDEAVKRAKADRLSRLQATDWTQLGDSPVQPVNEWRAYRQALRDITKLPGYPHNITWPEPPNSTTR